MSKQIVASHCLNKAILPLNNEKENNHVDNSQKHTVREALHKSVCSMIP